MSLLSIPWCNCMKTAASENLPEDIPPYDMDHLMAEVMLFVDWFLPAVSDRDVGQVARGDYEAVWQETLAALATKRETLVLRDYHVDNLMWLPRSDRYRAMRAIGFPGTHFRAPERTI